MKKLTAKVLLLGAQGVGKTSILMRQTGEGFSSQTKSTIGASFSQSTIDVDENTAVVLQIWDTAGQERFRSLVTMYYRNATAAFLVYDVADNASFFQIKSWVDELDRFVGHPVILCLVGNKTDLKSERQVERRTAEMFAETLGALYCETSALGNDGITEAFELTAKRIVEEDQAKLAESKNRLVNGYVDLNQPPPKVERKCC